MPCELAWTVGAEPFITASGSLVEAVRNAFFLGCVSAIYFWRAKTEERHLLSEDPKYRAYFDWMQARGLITAPLSRLFGALAGQRQIGSSAGAPAR